MIIDVCTKDGVWFDADELRRIVEFIRSGGLEQAARREAEELRAQKARLASAAPAFAHYDDEDALSDVVSLLEGFFKKPK